MNSGTNEHLHEVRSLINVMQHVFSLVHATAHLSTINEHGMYAMG